MTLYFVKSVLKGTNITTTGAPLSKEDALFIINLFNKGLSNWTHTIEPYNEKKRKREDEPQTNLPVKAIRLS
jgi:hypothetical protein